MANASNSSGPLNYCREEDLFIDCRMCNFEADCDGNMFCDDGECSCGYLYALDGLCDSLTPMSLWSVGSRTATMLLYLVCGLWILRILFRVAPPNQGCKCTPSRAALSLMLMSFLFLGVDMAYAVVFLSNIGFGQPVNWMVQRGLRNLLEGMAYACGCLSGLMISLSWIDAILATRQLQRISQERIQRTRAGIGIFMFLFTFITVGLNLGRTANPARDSDIYRWFISIIVVCAVFIMGLFLFGAWKVHQMLAMMAVVPHNIAMLDRSSSAAMRLLPHMVRAALRCCGALLGAVLSSATLPIAHYSWRSLQTVWVFVFLSHVGFACACMAICMYVEQKHADHDAGSLAGSANAGSPCRAEYNRWSSDSACASQRGSQRISLASYDESLRQKSAALAAGASPGAHSEASGASLGSWAGSPHGAARGAGGPGAKAAPTGGEPNVEMSALAPIAGNGRLQHGGLQDDDGGGRARLLTRVLTRGRSSLTSLFASSRALVRDAGTGVAGIITVNGPRSSYQLDVVDDEGGARGHIGMSPAAVEKTAETPAATRRWTASIAPATSARVRDDGCSVSAGSSVPSVTMLAASAGVRRPQMSEQI